MNSFLGQDPSDIVLPRDFGKFFAGNVDWPLRQAATQAENPIREPGN